MQDSIAPNEKSGDLRVQTGMRAVIGLPTANLHIGDAVGGTNCGTVVFFTPKWNVCVLPARTQMKKVSQIRGNQRNYHTNACFWLYAGFHRPK